MSRQFYIHEPSDNPTEEKGIRINKEEAGDYADKIVYSFSTPTDHTPERKTASEAASASEWVYVVEGNRCLGREQLELGGGAEWVDVTSDTYWTASGADGNNISFNSSQSRWESPPSATVGEIELNAPYTGTNVTGVRATIGQDGVGPTETTTIITTDLGTENDTQVIDTPVVITLSSIDGVIGTAKISVSASGFSGNLTISNIEFLTEESL